MIYHQVKYTTIGYYCLNIKDMTCNWVLTPPLPPAKAPLQIGNPASPKIFNPLSSPQTFYCLPDWKRLLLHFTHLHHIAIEKDIL